MTVRGRFVPPASPQKSDVVVKVVQKWGHGNPNFVRNSVRGKIAYMNRDETLNGFDERGAKLDPEQANAKVSRWGGDERYYNAIISPRDSRRLDLQEFTIATVEKFGEDLLTRDEMKRGAAIEFVAYQHWDTDHPHVHVLMRANVEGRELRLTNGYICHGMRARAEEVATSMLGYRIERERDEKVERDLLMARRAGLGLDPATGKPPTADPAAGQSTTKAKTKERAMEAPELDGGIG